MTRDVVLGRGMISLLFLNVCLFSRLDEVCTITFDATWAPFWRL